MTLRANAHDQGRTIVAVLHDLNHACRYASHLIAMKDGAIVAEGKPSAIVTERLVEDVFGLRSVIIPDPVSNTPLIVPKGRQALDVTATAHVVRLDASIRAGEKQHRD